MGSKSWHGRKGVQCPVCDMWLDSNNKTKVPSHKPKGDILAARDCSGTGQTPKQIKGFPGDEWNQYRR